MSNSRSSVFASRVGRWPGVVVAATVLLTRGVGAAALPTTLPPHARVADARHLHLERSEPAANDTIKSPLAALRLWFSEQPELAVTTVRLSGTTGSAVALAPLTRDSGTDAPVVAPLRAQPPAGTYTVWWRSTARDGHVSTGQFQFVIAPSGSKGGATPGQ